MKTYSKYRRAEDLLEYGRHYKKDLPFNYYDFMADYAAAGPASHYCSQYYEDFLNGYYPYRFSQYQKSEMMYAYRKEGDHISYLQILMEEIFKNETITPEIELALSQICYRVAKADAESMAQAFPRYKELVTNKRFRGIIKGAIEMANV